MKAYGAERLVLLRFGHRLPLWYNGFVVVARSLRQSDLGGAPHDRAPQLQHQQPPSQPPFDTQWVRPPFLSGVRVRMFEEPFCNGTDLHKEGTKTSIRLHAAHVLALTAPFAQMIGLITQHPVIHVTMRLASSWIAFCLGVSRVAIAANKYGCSTMHDDGAPKSIGAPL